MQNVFFDFYLSSLSSKIGFNSSSTMSLAGDLELEDKLVELESLIKEQTTVIEKQRSRIKELEGNERSIGKFSVDENNKTSNHEEVTEGQSSNGAI